MSSVLTFVWYLVVSTPQGGITVMPVPFDTRDDCQAAITEYARDAASDGWVLKCIPSTSGYMGDEGFLETPGEDDDTPAE